MAKKEWTKRTIKISKKYTATQRKAIAQEVLDYIRDRSADGMGPGNAKWPGKYSKEYKNSLDYKIAGKSGVINQELSGEMLYTMKQLNNKSGEIKYGFNKNMSAAGKAEGNIRGSYGKKRGSKAKARDFLTLTSDEMKVILNKFPLKDKPKLAAAMLLARKKEEAAKDILEDIEIEREGTGI